MGFISRFALRNPAVIALILALVVASGIYSAFSLHQEAFPDISLPYVTITTNYSGASATQIRDNVTEPIEAALSGISGLQALDSTSAGGISRVVAQFQVGSDTHALQRSVQDAINGATLPTSASRPLVTLNGPNSRPIMTYSLVGSDVASLTDAAQNTVIPALQALGGVSFINPLGGAPRDVIVTYDPALMKQFGVTIADLDRSIGAATVYQPVGAVTVGGTSQSFTAGNTPADLAAIKALPIISSATALLGGGASSGQSGQSSSSSSRGGGTGSKVMSEVGIYLQSAHHFLIAYGMSIGGGPATGTPPVTGAWSNGAESNMIDALSVLNKDPASVAQDVRNSIQFLTTSRYAKKNPKSLSDSNFLNALVALNDANNLLTLSGSGAKKVTVGDVATVSLGTPGIGAVIHSNGGPGVLLQISRTDTADTNQVAASVRKTLAGLALPRGMQLIKLFDSSDVIASSIGGATREALIGALLAVVIIGLFLRNWRATLIAVTTIPVAFLLTLICLNALGLTLNVITLAGFAVATGRVVDDSIVVIENLYRRIAAGERVTRASILAGVVDVNAAIASSTATTVCVFLPLAFVAGLVSTFFAPFAWTVTIALISSYLAAVTVVPLMAYALFRSGGVAQERDENAVTRRYRGALAWSLNHRAIVLVGAALTVVLAFLIYRRTPSNLIPQTGPATAVVNISAPPGTTVEATGSAALAVERAIKADSDVTSYYTTIGDVNRGGLFGATSRIVQSNQGTITVNFKSGADGTAATNHLRDLLSQGHYGVTADTHLAGDANSALEVDVTGSNPTNIQTVTQQVEKIVTQVGVGAVASVTDTLSAAKPELQAIVDPAHAAQYGLTAGSIVTQLQALVNGVTVGHVTLSGATRSSDVVVSITSTALATPAALQNLLLSTGGGGTVTLGQVATVRHISSIVLVTRHNQQLAARVTGSITQANVGGISNRIDRLLRVLKLPGDTTVTLAGVTQQQRTAFANVYNSMIVAVILVFIVMVLAFRTIAAPTAILFSLPVTFIGAISGLAVGRQTMGLPALIGFLMLIGIVVTNAIVLMSRVQQYRTAGAATRQALLDAGVNRLRPIVMTAVATIGALIPLSLGLAEGSLISQSLADAVIGGLVSSTVLTLVVVPVVFSLLVPDKPIAPLTDLSDEAEAAESASAPAPASKPAVAGVGAQR